MHVRQGDIDADQDCLGRLDLEVGIAPRGKTDKKTEWLPERLYVGLGPLLAPQSDVPP
jgi:hypothetical protein